MLDGDGGLVALWLDVNSLVGWSMKRSRWGWDLTVYGLLVVVALSLQYPMG